MFNELKRMYHYQAYYLFDSVCDIIQSIIFITGILFILRYERIELFYFWLIYISSTAVLLNNGELEYEIRTNQYESLITNKKSIYKVYTNRLNANFIFNTCIFVIAIMIYLPFDNKQIYMSFDLDCLPRYLIICMINMTVIYVINLIVIKLTILHKRISVMLAFFNYMVLFLSGMIFNVRFFTYRNLLDSFADIIINALTKI